MFLLCVKHSCVESTRKCTNVATAASDVLVGLLGYSLCSVRARVVGNGDKIISKDKSVLLLVVTSPIYATENKLAALCVALFCTIEVLHIRRVIL